MDSKREELEDLLFEWEAGSLDERGIERLRAILRADKAARRHYIQLQMLEAALKLESDVGLGLPASETPLPTPADRPKIPTKHVGFHFAAWLTAALVVCILVGRLLYWEFGQRPDPTSGPSALQNPIEPRKPSEPTARGIALVTRLVDVNWEQDKPSYEIGDALEPGPFAIRSGYAQIEFFCGATVVLEGPAELTLDSATLARVHRGRLRAQVPPAARGFSLEVEDMKVVDLGTEFGLDVSAKGTDLQVFDGEVELHSGAEKKFNLTTGKGLFRSKQGEYEPTETTPERFLDITALETRVQGQRNARFERWTDWSASVRSDPRLLAYYAFEEGDSSSRKLKSSLRPINSELDGAIVGASRASGRWPAKGALEFKRPADRVRVQIPGEYGSLTFACWVKIDSLDRWYNSLFLTDGYDKGEPHWQILDTGQLFFSIRARGPGEKGPPHKPVLSEPFWSPSMIGKWLHVATTFDVETGTVTHYLNGKVLKREVLPETLTPKTTRFGVASLGNWALPLKPDAEYAIRNLNGSIDEFALFSAALTHEEIEQMYQQGKP